MPKFQKNEKRKKEYLKSMDYSKKVTVLLTGRLLISLLLLYQSTSSTFSTRLLYGEIDIEVPSRS